jgi:hypothetical protein
MTTTERSHLDNELIVCVSKFALGKPAGVIALAREPSGAALRAVFG